MSKNGYTLTGSGSVSYQQKVKDGKPKTITHKKGDEISAAEYNKVPKRQKTFFTKTSELEEESGSDKVQTVSITNSIQFTNDEAAIQAIELFHDPDALAFFVKGDDRKTVKEAATKRLSELKKSGDSK